MHAVESQPVVFIQFNAPAQAAAATVAILAAPPGANTHINYVIARPPRVAVNSEETLECTSATAHVELPGLEIVHEFVSREEEQVLVAEIDAGTRWEHMTTTKRRIMHYMYGYNYLNNTVDHGAGFFHPPKRLQALIDKTVDECSPVQVRGECVGLGGIFWARFVVCVRLCVCVCVCVCTMWSGYILWWRVRDNCSDLSKKILLHVHG